MAQRSASFEAGRRFGAALGLLLVLAVAGGLVVAVVVWFGPLGVFGLLLGTYPVP